MGDRWRVVERSYNRDRETMRERWETDGETKKEGERKGDKLERDGDSDIIMQRE